MDLKGEATLALQWISLSHIRHQSWTRVCFDIKRGTEFPIIIKDEPNPRGGSSIDSLDL